MPKRASWSYAAELAIEPDGGYIVSVKSPDQPSPPGAGRRVGRKPDFPGPLAETFRGRRFANLDPPEPLDYEGAEHIIMPQFRGESR
jgi:hypothetical protein